jgi:hypothetical protein
MFPRLFRASGATGHVFLLKNGKTRNRGLAYSGFIGPMTTVAVVPTVPQILNFAVDGRTSDKQIVSVSGDLKVTLDPAVAITKFDFTVEPGRGSYLSPWQESLQGIVVERILGPVRDKLKGMSVEEAIRSHKDIEEVLKKEIENSSLSEKGVVIDSCSVQEVEAVDDEVGSSIGAKERQTMLVEADKALHDRRIKAAENDRAVQTYEAQTKLKLEEERGNLLEELGKNKKKEAEDDAAAMEVRLGPLASVDAGKILGASLMEMAKGGRIGNLVISPELLAALGQK